MLGVFWDERLQQIGLSLMGSVQLEVVRELLRERYGLDVGFGPGKILYKETISASVMGIGHFEPLRHYAEAHLRLDPGPRGSGVVCLNGAAARFVSVGDKVIIMCYAQMDQDEARGFKPHVVFVDENNHVSRLTCYEKHGLLEDMA